MQTCLKHTLKLTKLLHHQPFYGYMFGTCVFPIAADYLPCIFLNISPCSIPEASGLKFQKGGIVRATFGKEANLGI